MLGHAARPQNGHAARPQNGHAARPQKGHAARPQKGHAVRPQNGHAARPQNGHAVRPQNGHAARPQNGHAARPQNGHAVRPHNGHAARPQNGHAVRPQNGHAARPQRARLLASTLPTAYCMIHLASQGDPYLNQGPLEVSGWNSKCSEVSCCEAEGFWPVCWRHKDRVLVVCLQRNNAADFLKKSDQILGKQGAPFPWSVA